MSDRYEFVDESLIEIVTDPEELQERFEDANVDRVHLVIGSPSDAAAVLTGRTHEEIATALDEIASALRAAGTRYAQARSREDFLTITFVVRNPVPNDIDVGSVDFPVARSFVTGDDAMFFAVQRGYTDHAVELGADPTSWDDDATTEGGTTG